MSEKDVSQEQTEETKDASINEESVETVDDEELVEEDKRDETKEMNELKNELAKLTEEKDQIYNRLLRLQAEYDNYKKRTQKEKVAERKYKSQDLATELLPALDNFERALNIEDVPEEMKGFFDGMSMIYRQITEVLKAEDITEIETVGKAFDPNIHHAVMQVEDDSIDSNIVVEELQKGYVLKDKVLRPAMVKVNK
ncbi:MAG TPA: nucleotide exchange factor GrpE [Cerasibacillus sp.]|uniref:nucleotide exchange factor GrpE n=1 Tax=Cerasibacillus sp. TaxID=2498711 RepID=UPI002F417C6A